MRKVVPNKFKRPHPLFQSLLDPKEMTGAYLIPYKRFKLLCIVSCGMGWEHVSVTVNGKNRCPTWEEMCFVKNKFWEKEETVVQYHPPESEYVNNHPYCLHLWKQIGKEIELPNNLMVGIKAS